MKDTLTTFPLNGAAGLPMERPRENTATTLC